MYMEKNRIDGKVALVTGGARGIGLHCSEALAEAGARVIIGGRTVEGTEDGRDTLRAKGYDVDSVAIDVTDSERVTAVADEIADQYGGVDILINNAGILRAGGAAENLEDEHWRNVLDVNLNGTFWCCRAFGKHMLAHGAGAIVNIGSISGVIINKPQLMSYYNTSKAAVHHLTKALAVEWATRGVRVNCVAPGYIATAMNEFVKSKPEWYGAWMGRTPTGRFGTAEEVASAVLFLSSDASRLLTGSIVMADGGYTCW